MDNTLAREVLPDKPLGRLVQNDHRADNELDKIALLIMDLVESSGSGFAFPSQILYMSKDEGLDESRGAEAAEAVRRWRDEGELPFPDHSPARVSQLNCTLEYPPGGSVLSGNKDHP